MRRIRLSQYNPALVHVSPAPSRPPTSYLYNLDKQLTTITRPDSGVVSFAYDSAGRPSSVTHPDGSITYGYSTWNGNLESLSTGTETLVFQYDGSLLEGVTWSGEVAGQVSARYDDNFRVSEMSVNWGNTKFFDYDSDGLLTWAGDLEITRDAQNGRIDSTALSTVTTAESYDSYGQWEERSASTQAGDIYRATYTRDLLGRITALTEVLESDTTMFEFVYDSAGRLEEVETDGVVSAIYEYDSNGNRLSVTRAGGVDRKSVV